MAVEKLPEVNPPFGRVPGRGLLTLPISEALGGGTMEKFAILEVVEGFPLRRLNIGQRRAPEEVGPTQAASWRGQGLGRASRSHGRPLAPLWPIFGDPKLMFR